MNRRLSNLGLCRKAGQLILGFGAVADAVKANQVSMLLYAEDLSERTKKEVQFLASRYHVPIQEFPFSMEDIQDVIGKKAGVMAVLSQNFVDLLSVVSQGEKRRNCIYDHKV